MNDANNVINSILRSYFTASDKATGKVRYYSRFKGRSEDLLSLRRSRVVGTYVVSKIANPKGLSRRRLPEKV